MEMTGLLALALFLFIAKILSRVLEGRSAAAAGVPAWLWALGFVTVNPLVVISFVAFVLCGVAAKATWRRWVVHVATALGLLMWLLPVSVPASGVYPQDSARPFNLLPSFDFSLSASSGDSSTQMTGTRDKSNGWAVHRVVIIADGHPISAKLTHVVAETLYRSGIHDVRFVQSDDALPTPAGELFASVSVRPTLRFDLGGAAFWSGDVTLDINPWPFEKRFKGNSPAPSSAGALIANWNVSALRLGPASGEARYDFVMQQLGDVELMVTDMLDGSGKRKPIAVASDAAVGVWEEPALDGPFAPLQLEPIIAGPAHCADQIALWRVQLGEDPEADLRSLADRLLEAGWDRALVRPWVMMQRAGTFELVTQQRAEGRLGYLTVTPSLEAMRRLETRVSPTFRLDSGEEPDSDRPVPREYHVSLTQHFDRERLEALALRLLDGNLDDYTLRILGDCVPADRYDDWRSSVLAGDCSVANLLHVAAMDRRRGGRDQAVAALVEVAAWIASSGGPHNPWGSRDLQRTVTERAESFRLGKQDFSASLPLETLVQAGVPLLDENWRPLPELLVERRPTQERDDAAVHRQGYSARRFAVEGPEGVPVIVRLELVDFLGGPRLAVVEVGRGFRYAPLEEVLESEDRLATFPRRGGIFDLRRVDARYEARWQKAE